MYQQLFVVNESNLKAYKRVGLEPEVAQIFAEYNNENVIQDIVSKRVIRSSWWNALQITLSAGAMFQEYLMEKPFWHNMTYYVIGGLVILHGIYNWMAACAGQLHLLKNITTGNNVNEGRNAPPSSLKAFQKLGLEPIVSSCFFKHAAKEEIVDVSTRLWIKQCASSLLYFCMGGNFFVQEFGPFDKFPLWHEITFYTLSGLLAITSLYNMISVYFAHDKILNSVEEKSQPLSIQFSEHPPEQEPQGQYNWRVTMRT